MSGLFLWGLFLAGGVVKSSRYSWDCSRNSDRRMVLATDLSALEGDDEVGLEIVMGEVAFLCIARDGPGTGVCPVTAIAMVAEGHPCDVSTTFSLKSCPSALLELGKPVLWQWQSPRITISHCTHQ